MTCRRILERKEKVRCSILMNGNELDASISFTQLGLSLSSNLVWKSQTYSIAKHASEKLDFLARARGFFSYSQLPTIHNSQIQPSLEYCSHVWCGAPKPTLCLLDKVQPKAMSKGWLLEHRPRNGCCISRE